ncbi:homoserine kinase [Chloracidobacterium validum]|uniref:Homoserine kinase n=1 Tax=Chloracidobacterium validum TaxID=2821543 RepID=A0ABX8BB02_9BACT|nr:homoserine kinase [Chloracidobacterium validum]QUW02818.1 homoserine kinase [Chloracidobacterium validum]
MVERKFEICVPASTANLGPGFDTMGLAVGIYLTVRGQIRTDGADWRLSVAGQHTSSIPLDPDENLMCRVARQTAARAYVNLPPLDLHIINDIPLGSGLGSSAAAIIAGVSLVEAVTGMEFSQGELLRHAMAFENYTDNLAPARYGGWITSCGRANGTPILFHRTFPADIRLVIVTPDFPLPTEQMRAILPDAIPRAEAIFQMQHVMMFVGALEHRRYDLLREAMRDHLHQPYRAPFVPGLAEILELECDGLWATALSGAGPSALALASHNLENIAAAMQRCFAAQGRQSFVYQPAIDTTGRTIRYLPPGEELRPEAAIMNTATP